jgi:hypothetical protein
MPTTTAADASSATTVEAAVKAAKCTCDCLLCWLISALSSTTKKGIVLQEANYLFEVSTVHDLHRANARNCVNRLQDVITPFATCATVAAIAAVPSAGGIVSRTADGVIEGLAIGSAIIVGWTAADILLGWPSKTPYVADILYVRR